MKDQFGGLSKIETPEEIRKHFEEQKSTEKKNLERQIACVNACAGMSNPAEAIEGLKRELKNAYQDIQAMMNCPDIEDYQTEEKTCERIKAALKAAGVKL